MITAGIDMGAQTVKVVILQDKQILSYSLILAGWNPLGSAENALELAMAQGEVNQGDIEQIVATGIGRKIVSFANTYATEVTCDAKGAAWLRKTTKGVIDIGAEESRALKCDAGGRVTQFAANDKCAAGVGAFLEAMARALEISVEEMAELSLQSHKEVPVNATCVIFAESEVVSLVHAKTPKADIARAIHDAIASRTVSMARRAGVEKDVTLIGGVARNIGVVDCLKRRLGTELWVPENPQIVGALGAALVAQSTREQQ